MFYIIARPDLHEEAICRKQSEKYGGSVLVFPIRLPRFPETDVMENAAEYIGTTSRSFLRYFMLRPFLNTADLRQAVFRKGRKGYNKEDKNTKTSMGTG